MVDNPVMNVDGTCATFTSGNVAGQLAYTKRTVRREVRGPDHRGELPLRFRPRRPVWTACANPTSVLDECFGGA